MVYLFLFLRLYELPAVKFQNLLAKTSKEHLIGRAESNILIIIIIFKRVKLTLLSLRNPKSNDILPRKESFLISDRNVLQAIQLIIDNFR